MSGRSSKLSRVLSQWTWWVPLLGWIALVASMTLASGAVAPAIVGVFLAGSVFAAVHHAEVVAHRIGEPFGTLVLAVAVTVIEVALIVSMMISGGEAKAALARDTVFAAIMIVCNGIVGICLLVGGIRHREQTFQLQGASSALGVLAALSVLALVLPNFAIAVPGPIWSPPQLVFSGIASLVLYAAFVFIQTVRHRDYFLVEGATSEDEHAAPPSRIRAIASAGLLLACLVAVVGLAKVLTPAIESAVDRWGAPASFVGIIIAALVLLPEGLAACKAAFQNRLQTSLNLALGSALASIGLTIPTIAAIFVATGDPLVLGLGPMEVVLLMLTLLVSTITLGTGRTNVLQGVVHLVIFAAFVFLAVVP